MRATLCAVLLLAVGCESGDTCETRDSAIGEVCIPPSLAPDLGPVLDVREACGPACGSPPTCAALFTNGRVRLTAEQEICSSNLAPSCVDQGCRQMVMRCTLPPLPAGDYTVEIAGAPPRTLHVAAGGVASCRLLLPDGGVP